MNHKSTNEPNLDYYSLGRLVRSHTGEIIFAQWVDKGEHDIYPRPNIFVGVVLELEMTPRNFIGASDGIEIKFGTPQMLTSGVGAIQCVHTGKQYFPVAKKQVGEQDQVVGLARMVDSRKQTIFRDSEVGATWDNCYKELIKQLHNRNPSKEIKEWIEHCEVSCLQYHHLMQVYLATK